VGDTSYYVPGPKRGGHFPPVPRELHPCRYENARYAIESSVLTRSHSLKNLALLDVRTSSNARFFRPSRAFARSTAFAFEGGRTRQWERYL